MLERLAGVKCLLRDKIAFNYQGMIFFTPFFFLLEDSVLESALSAFGFWSWA